jgi:hypothetical protein
MRAARSLLTGERYDQIIEAAKALQGREQSPSPSPLPVAVAVAGEDNGDA